MDGTITRQEIFLLGISLVAPACLAGYAFLLFLTPSLRTSTQSERTFLSPSSPGSASSSSSPSRSPLPQSLNSTTPLSLPTIALSIIVPAYNESDRLPIMLADLRSFLASPSRTRAEAFGLGIGKELRGWEVIVADDGSRDETAEVALGVGRDWDGKEGGNEKELGRGEIRVVRLEKNRGKGGAVKHGILHSRGARVLFADADGASTFSSLAKLQADLDNIEIPFPSTTPLSDSSATSASSTALNGSTSKGVKDRSPRPSKTRGGEAKGTLGMAVGSRAHLVSTDLVVKRSFLRNFLMHGFHFFVRTLGVKDIRDTQCGFKLFTRPTAALLFPAMHLERWSFDVELLVLADSITRVYPGTASASTSLKIPVAETPIEWNEIPGSKIRLGWDSLGMALDLVVLRVCLLTGRWERPVIGGSEGDGEKKETSKDR